MKTSFEFIHQGHRVKAEYEQTLRLNMKLVKVFSFRVLEGSAWIYQCDLSFAIKATKKQMIEQAGHLLYGTQEAGDE